MACLKHFLLYIRGYTITGQHRCQDSEQNTGIIPSPYEHVNCKRISYQKKCKTIGQAKLIDNHTRLKLQIAEYTAAVSTQNYTITMKKYFDD